MFVTSIIIGIFGVLAEGIWYTQDWWKPQTITHTLIGIEDFFLAFSTGGISSVIYKELFHKTIYKSVRFKTNHWILVLPLLTVLMVTHVLFVYFKWFSFWANITGFGIGLLGISLLRKDLEEEAIKGGLLFTLLIIPVYWILNYFYPAMYLEIWNFKKISGIFLLGIPYEDLVWWFFAGAFAAVLYDYWNVLRLRNVRKAKIK